MRTMKLFFLLLLYLGTIPVFPQFDKYPSYPDYLVWMEEFQKNHPDLCKIELFGTSVQGRKLPAAKISDNVSESEQEPQFFLTSTHHGDELVGYVLSLRLIFYLLTHYGSDAQVTRLVNSVEIWINPLANPDGTYHGGESSVNGAIRQNANGADLNRDFPIPEDTNSATQPETKAFVELFSKEHFVMSADLISGLECAIYPWGYTTGLTVDDAWFRYVARQYADTAQKNGRPGYFQYADSGIVKQSDIYSPPGTFLDYVLYFHRCRDITIALSNQKMVQETQLYVYWDSNYRSLLDYIEEVLYGIRGTVSDLWTDEPLKAQLYIENYDTDNSCVYTFLPFGDFYRPLFAGVYDIVINEVQVGDYDIYPARITVENGKASVLDVKLTYPVGVIEKKSKNIFQVPVILVSRYNNNILKLSIILQVL